MLMFETLQCVDCRVDSVMLVEEGFQVTSTDASDKMLKYAMKERWSRRKQPAFDNWGMYNMYLWRFSWRLMLYLYCCY